MRLNRNKKQDYFLVCLALLPAIVSVIARDDRAANPHVAVELVLTTVVPTQCKRVQRTPAVFSEAPREAEGGLDWAGGVLAPRPQAPGQGAG